MIPFGLIYLIGCESDKAVTILRHHQRQILFHMIMGQKYSKGILSNLGLPYLM